MVLDFSSVQFQSDLYYGGAASALSVRKGALRSGAAAGNPDSGTVCVLADGPLSSSFPRQFWFARRLPAASRRTRADMLARRRAAGWARWLDGTSVHPPLQLRTEEQWARMDGMSPQQQDGLSRGGGGGGQDNRRVCAPNLPILQYLITAGATKRWIWTNLAETKPLRHVFKGKSSLLETNVENRL